MILLSSAIAMFFFFLETLIFWKVADTNRIRYTSTCTKLIAQFKTATLAAQEYAPDIEAFMAEYGVTFTLFSLQKNKNRQLIFYTANSCNVPVP